MNEVFGLARRKGTSGRLNRVQQCERLPHAWEETALEAGGLGVNPSSTNSWECLWSCFSFSSCHSWSVKQKLCPLHKVIVRIKQDKIYSKHEVQQLLHRILPKEQEVDKANTFRRIISDTKVKCTTYRQILCLPSAQLFL